ncbi:MAG: DEDD exonuclease domain-containing protein [Ilumatobacteraceae bacterium]
MATAGAQKTFADIGLPLDEVTFCVIDFETTGSSAEADRITEIGAAKYRGGECLGTFQTLVNPGCAIPPFITILTGITEAMVLPAPRIESLLGSLTHFIGDAVIVAHNARFDVSFLNAALVRDGREPLNNSVVDTVPLARRLVRDEVRDCKLGTLAAHFRLPHQPSHRALDDALATGDLLHLLLERAAGFGVLGLDDLLGLPRLETHPQAAKLRLTEDLPRTPGVYLFAGADGRILYVGKATNLRQRVRSYFSTSETRRKVGTLLRQVSAIHHIATPDVLTANVLELRLIQRMSPQYNRAGTTSEKYCYVRLTLHEEWPRLVVSKNPSSSRGDGDLYIGPLSSRSAARQAIEAIESVVPLRRCTVRLGRRYVAPTDAPVCSAAQLGVAYCPCSGTADPDQYRSVVQFVAGALANDPAPLLALLHDKIRNLAVAQRFEEAALMRDRTLALEAALVRQRRIDALRDAGTLRIETGDGVTYDIHNGVLQRTAHAGQLLDPVSLSLASAIGSLLAEHLLPRSADDGPSGSPHLRMPVHRHEVDELLCISRFLDEATQSVRLVECDGTWISPVRSVPELSSRATHRAA